MIDFFPTPAVLLSIGPVKFHFYGAMYALTMVMGIFTLPFFARLRGLTISRDMAIDILFGAMLGGVVGGRIFYALVYNFQFFLSHPLEIFQVWHGGMSIHGGLLGGALGVWYMAKKHAIPLWKLADAGAPILGLGLMFGRFGNFINGELPGRITTVPWAMDFGDGEMRHPAQLYAAGKDFFLFLLAFWMVYKSLFLATPGRVFAIILMSYGILRFFIEFFREPDSQLGFLAFGLSMGQILSVVVMGVGFAIYVDSGRSVDSALSCHNHKKA
ncbi:MAG: prolipoprotein diacylglyceryl transferase [Candidatus Peregrinibacteria bacterium]